MALIDSGGHRCRRHAGGCASVGSWSPWSRSALAAFAPRSAAVATDRLGRRRSRVRARRAGLRRGRVLRGLHRCPRRSSAGARRDWRAALAICAPGLLLVGRAGIHARRPPVPRASDRVRRRSLPARQPGRPVHLVAADRLRVRRHRRCGGWRRSAWCATGSGAAIVRSRLALPAVVATGFFVRVITLLTVAPERTDGGDPLFYHTTANVLARGRGFPEPLQLDRLRGPPPQRVPRPAVPGRALDQLTVRRHELLRPQDDVDPHRHGVVLAAGMLGRRLGGPIVGLVAARRSRRCIRTCG